MSGTSLDGVDCVCVDLSTKKPRLIAQHYEAYDATFIERIQALCLAKNDAINALAQADVECGRLFAKACNRLLAQAQLSTKDIIAIGSHGQNIRHYPTLKDYPFTLQIGDPNIIATETGIITVADFRRKDISLGGQGAPLAPGFHQAILQDPEQDRIVLNIGGIANITYLSKNKQIPVIGFDTGPGNTLLDSWIALHQQKSHDANGQWAQSGKINEALLQALLTDPYFALPAPKSTGREYFNLQWLQKRLDIFPTIEPINVQATLLELTVSSITHSIQNHFQQIDEILVCGGGTHNSFLMQQLQTACATSRVNTTEVYGIDPNLMEAMAFAWLAQQTIEQKPGNLPGVTGAKRSAILGGIYFP
jgi:anhydro-N-acetylmuramic acid kinase